MKRNYLKLIPLLILTLFLISCTKKGDVKEPPSIVLTAKAGFFNITYELEIADEDEVLTLLNMELFKGFDLVQTISDFNNHEFTNLLANTEYTMRLNYQFDLNDGMGLKTLTKDIKVKTKKVELPEIDVEYKEISTNLIDFVLQVKNNDFIEEIKSIQLYENDILIQTITDLTNLQFINLTPNTHYAIVINYTYDLKDGSGLITEQFETVIQTIGYKVPIVTITDIETTINSIEFDLDIEDLDNVFKNIVSVKLFKDDELIEALTNFTNLSFEDLLVDTNYLIEVTYKYKVSSEEDKETTITMLVKTKEKDLPIVKVENIVVTTNSIDFDLKITDIEELGHIDEINLYKAGVLVDTLTNFNFLYFTYLDSNTLYELEVIYIYNLADGSEDQIINYKINVKTNAHLIDVYNVTLLNSQVPEVGKEIHLRIEYENEDNLNINTIFINEEEHTIYKKESKNSILVKYIPNFPGGIYDVLITGFSYKENSEILTLDIIDGYLDNILIIEKIEILDIYDYYEDGYFVESTNNYLYIELDNKNSYDIIALTIDIDGKEYIYEDNEITKYSDDLILIQYKAVVFNEVNRTNYETVYTIKKITYGEYFEGYTTYEYNESGRLFIVKSGNIININSIEDLQSGLDDGYIYRINTDINASGYNWVPYSFTGIIYGNNKTINKISYTVDEDTEKNILAGLFTEFKGLITDLKITNMYLSLKTKGQVFAGAVAGNANGKLDNVEVIDSSIYVKNENITYIGGLTGSHGGKILNSKISETNIEVINNKNNAEVYLGTLTGYGIDIYNSSSENNNLRLQSIAIANIGGLTGHANNISSSYALNNNIIVSSANQVIMGSLAGRLDSTLDMSYAKDIETNINSYMLVIYGGLIGYANKGEEEVIINNVYLNNLKANIKGSANATIFYGGISSQGGNINNAYVYKNDVTITASGSVGIGGIVSLGTEDTYIINSLVIDSEYIITNDKTTQVKGLLGNGDKTTITNSYVTSDFMIKLNNEYLNILDEKVLLIDLVEKTYYTETLNWDEEIWDLTELDFLNNKLPLLK